MSESTYRFGSFVFDIEALKLVRERQLCSLSPQAAQVLRALLERAGKSVPRQQLFDAAWPGLSVGQGSLTQAIWEIRRLLSADRALASAIRTVRGAGYAFVAPVAKLESAPRYADPGLLFGRARELEDLQALLREVTDGQGRSCLVLGPAGIGKSQLCRTLADCARERGLQVLTVHAIPDTGAPAFWPWLQLIAQRVHALNEHERARCAELAPLTAQLVPTLRGPHKPLPALESALLTLSSPVESRAYLLEDLTRLLCHLVGALPTLLWLDDIHCFDEPSRSLLPVFVRALGVRPTLLLASGRPTSDGQLERGLRDVTRAQPRRQLVLGGLDVPAVRQVLARYRPELTVVADDVHRLSHGNPLFVHEVARVLAQGPALTTLDLRERPELQSLLTERLQDLSADALQLLRAAAVSGIELDVTLGADVTKLSRPRVLAGLAELETSAWICERPGGGRFVFAHPLIRELVYTSTPRAERAVLHRMVAERCEQRGEQNRRASELAHHYYQAAAWGSASEALHYAKLAGEQASARTAHADAARHFAQALEAFDLGTAGEPHARVALQLSLGDALAAAGTPAPEVRAVYRAAAERAHELALPGSFALAALGFSGQHPVRFMPMRIDGTLDHDEIGLLEQALARRAELEPQEAILLLASLAFALAATPQHARRELLCNEAILLARSSGTPWLLARALLVRVHIATGPGQLATSRAACDELVALAERLGCRELSFEARLARLGCRLQTGDLTGARADAAVARRYAEQLGRASARERARALELLSAFWSGDIALAARLTAQAMQADPDDVRQRLVMALRMGMVWACKHGYDEPARGAVRVMAATFPYAETWPAALACAAAALGDDDEARAQFDVAARDDFRTLSEDHNWLPVMQLLGDTAVRLRDRPRAQLIYQRLVPYADRLVFHGLLATFSGAVAWTLGTLATTLGLRDAAERWFDAARPLYERIGSTLYLAALDLSHAQLLFTLGRDDEREHAQLLLSRAHSFADAYDIRWLLQDIARCERPSERPNEREPWHMTLRAEA